MIQKKKMKCSDVIAFLQNVMYHNGDCPVLMADGLPLMEATYIKKDNAVYLSDDDSE
jgi:prepilin-type processing-associated H-X9-DG protein